MSMYNGSPWIQAPSARYVPTLGDHYTNLSNLPNQRPHQYDNRDDRSVASSTLSARGVRPQDQRETWHHFNGSYFGNKERPDVNNWRGNPAKNFTLVLKSSPKQIKRPVPVYRTGPASRQLQRLKTWESTGSIPSVEEASLPNGYIQHPVDRQHQKAKRSVSVDRGALALQGFANPDAELMHKNQHGQTSKSHSSLSKKALQQNGYIGNGRSHYDSLNTCDTFNSQFPSNQENYRHLTMTKPIMTSTPKQNKMVQENFVWQNQNPPVVHSNHGNQNRPFNNQPEYVTNNTSYYDDTNRGNLDTIFFYGPEASPPSPRGRPILSERSRRRESRRGQMIPFTQKTGNESHAHFLQLMKPSIDQSNLKHNSRWPQVSTHSKPPIAPPRRSREKQYQSKQQFITDNRHKEQNDENVIYTEILPQTFTKRSKPEKLRRLRSRSNSPIIYTEVVPIDTAVQRVAPKLYPEENGHNRASMTFGDDLSITAAPEKPTHTHHEQETNHNHNQHPQIPKQPPINHKTRPTQYSSNFSISFGTPQLLLKRSVSDQNNNNIKQSFKGKKLQGQGQESNNEVKPFPSNSNLEQMLSSDASSSKKSGTMKSALKQPTAGFPGTRDQRSPKRVTIKENSSGRTTPITNGQAGYRRNPVSALTMTSIENLRDVTERRMQPQHRLHVPNRNFMWVK